jgi:hypothetical protein
MLTWKAKVEAILSSELDFVISKIARWAADGNGLGVAGAELDEIIHHCRLAYKKRQSFIAREELVDEAMGIIGGCARQDMNGISLCIIGVSGCGKTALMAKLAGEVTRQFPDQHVIIRFCGTSQGSVDGLGLIRSICLQIHLIYSIPLDVIPSIYEDAVEHFQGLLKEYAVTLFIDSLDQLSDTYQARSKLSFLVGLQCHLDGRIIVSALPDEKDESTGQWGKYVYLCDTRLKELKVPRVTVSTFKSNRQEAKEIILGQLDKIGRSISENQMRFVLDRVEEEPTVLYLTLAINVVQQWTSSWVADAYEGDVTGSTSTICELRGTVKGLIHQIFDSFERDYGKELARMAIGVITFSREGLIVFIFTLSSFIHFNNIFFDQGLLT